jgi:hypothetical protein
MRKYIVPAVIVIVIIAAGGYTAFWFKQADNFKHMLEQSIAALNDQAKSLKSDNTLVKYDSIHVTGYPTHMVLEIIKPVVDVPMSAFLQKTSTPPTVIAAAPPASEWIEEISYGEKVSFTGDITGSHFTLVAAGDRTHKSIVNRTTRHTLISSSVTPLTCHIAVEHPRGAPWTMQPIFSDLPTFLSIFRAFDCNVHGVVLKDAATGTSLFTADNFSTFASHNPMDGINHALTFKLDYQNAIAFPASDAIVKEYADWSYSALGMPADTYRALPSLYGNQNASFDMHYEGTIDKLNDAAAMHLTFDINKFNMKNALLDTELQAHIKSMPQGTVERTTSIVINGRTEVSELYDEIIAKQLAAIFSSLQHDEADKAHPELKQLAIQMGTPEEIAAALTPHLHNLGKISLDMNVNAKGANRTDLFLKNGIFTVDAMDLVATPYGIKIKGMGNASIQGKSPSADISITCITCDTLVNDAGSYAMRIQSVFNRIQPGKQPYVTVDLLEGIKQFLHGIAENSADKNPQDLVIHIVMKDTGEFTISGKQVIQVLGLYGTTIAPRLSAAPPTPQAPVAQTPQPAAPKTK